ncbi:proton extrusion protein PcxA [Okeanomitos corallinicola TIOX110]|uniref:Proton extrusion protein PxcA n=1 Tax=Okeanomitos corallinicola TIOX110 TaxID=3133117 RepID=A0ABZ2UTX1_9CYAN
MKGSFLNRSTKLISQKLTQNWHSFNNWFVNTPERAILEAYQAAKAIQHIENEQFNGQKISPEFASYSENVMAFWQGNLNRNIAIIKVRLAEFQLGIKFVNTSDSNVIEKLNFIDEIIAKYNTEYEVFSETESNYEQQFNNNSELDDKEPPMTQKTGVFPRSIGRTFNRIAQDFAPKAEEDFVKKYRTSRNRTRRAIKFLLLLIILPLLTQHFSKELLIKPVFKNFIYDDTRIFVNSEMEEKALNELHDFEKKLQFKSLLKKAPELSPENIEVQVKNKAIEIAEEFRYKSSSVISNLFADIISLVAFAMVIVFSKKDIVFLQSLLDKVVYGLSDSAKAFIIILVTDVFVGFHSPHGWEILLEGLANHLGLPASRNAIFLFIATFPVILNTIFKYWIFRYLSRLSPSALATLKEMDE